MLMPSIFSRDFMDDLFDMHRELTPRAIQRMD